MLCLGNFCDTVHCLKSTSLIVHMFMNNQWMSHLWMHFGQHQAYILSLTTCWFLVGYHKRNQMHSKTPFCYRQLITGLNALNQICNLQLAACMVMCTMYTVITHTIAGCMVWSITLTGRCRLLMIQSLPTLIPSSRVQYSTTVPAPTEMLGRKNGGGGGGRWKGGERRGGRERNRRWKRRREDKTEEIKRRQRSKKVKEEREEMNREKEQGAEIFLNQHQDYAQHSLSTYLSRLWITECITAQSSKVNRFTFFDGGSSSPEHRKHTVEVLYSVAY